MRSDRNVVVEIAEYKAEVTFEAAAKFFWDDLALANEASNSEMRAVTHMQSSCYPTIGTSCTGQLVVGDQSITNTTLDKCAGPKSITVFLAVLRLPDVRADVLLSWNDLKGLADAEAAALKTFKQMLRSFTITDLTLFDA
eukprot:GHVT01077301.1.p1 GENE.GHVT01077301.1~~GHVT01077301.1.p1  ORF type:complete len:140 (+),score=19.07 GHVT01077301.1:832-1251(+)